MKDNGSDSENFHTKPGNLLINIFFAKSQLDSLAKLELHIIRTSLYNPCQSIIIVL
jgi:hypothetical protein